MDSVIEILMICNSTLHKQMVDASAQRIEDKGKFLQIDYP